MLLGTLEALFVQQFGVYEQPPLTLGFVNNAAEVLHAKGKWATPQTSPAGS